MLYIHQYPDWTRFRYNFQNVMDALGQTRLQEGKLLGISEVVNAEGDDTQVLAEDIFANFAIDDPREHSERNRGESIAHIQAEIQKKNDATSKIRNILGAIQNTSQPLTAERLFAWHTAIGQNKVKNFRTKESAWGVSAERIEHEMDRFLQWFETSGEDGVIKAAIAQFWILTIRPFEDGNGRIARTLSAMLLSRSESAPRIAYALNQQILQNREEYLQILAKAQSGNGDLTQWILWFLKMLRQAISERQRNLSQAVQKLQFQQKFQNTDFTPRERKIIDAVRAGTLPVTFSVRDAAALTEVSHDSALRDIQSLIQKGVARADKKGGRSSKYTLRDTL